MTKALKVYRNEGVTGLFQAIKDHLYWRYRKNTKLAQLRARWIMQQTTMDVEVFRIHWIDPDEIEYIAGVVTDSEPGAYHIEEIDPVPNREVSFGSVVGGDWDVDTVEFESMLTYRSLHEHFVNERDWEETELYREHKKRIRRGYRSFNSRSLKELTQKLSRYDRLYKQIRSRGYQTQRERNGDPLDEIRISLGRSGQILYHGEGRHRLSIAKLLGLDKMPVLVHTRHERLLYPSERRNSCVE